ncbi:MAG TPA: glycogen-binding domain-containing protein [Gemmatimonadales bacterium]|nr:glycogen-binding domain-containing protein [Gemmatimonadales bacterium]
MSARDERLHQALDGEIDTASLPPEQQRDLRRLLGAAALLSQGPPGSVHHRVMAALRQPRRSPARRLAHWLTAPHALTFAVRPIWSLALAAVLAVVAVFPAHGPGPVLSAEEGIVQFVGRFPSAHSVDVVGSFTDWRRGIVQLRDDDHDGTWDGSVVLPVGHHEYMFVVDGEQWVTDPLAGRYVADGFGRQNALLIVRPAVATAASARR